MNAKELVINALHRMELTNGESFTVKHVMNQVNVCLVLDRSPFLISGSGVCDVLLELRKTGYKGAAVEHVTVSFGKEIGEFVVSW